MQFNRFLIFSSLACKISFPKSKFFIFKFIPQKDLLPNFPFNHIQEMRSLSRTIPRHSQDILARSEMQEAEELILKEIGPLVIATHYLLHPTLAVSSCPACYSDQVWRIDRDGAGEYGVELLYAASEQHSRGVLKAAHQEHAIP